MSVPRALAATPRQVFFRLRFPAALPYLFTALRISATISVVGAIIGELPVGSRYGMGVVIINAAQYYNWRPANLWAAILVSSSDRGNRLAATGMAIVAGWVFITLQMSCADSIGEMMRVRFKSSLTRLR